jgi:hypothetical protein
LNHHEQDEPQPEGIAASAERTESELTNDDPDGISGGIGEITVTNTTDKSTPILFQP